jgi:hypothetical protein
MMRNFQLFIFIAVVYSQTNVWKSSTLSLNTYGWVAWDYYKAKLYYFCRGEEFKCSVSTTTTTCSKKTTASIPITYVLTDDYYFFNGASAYRTHRISYLGSGNYRTFSPDHYIVAYQSIAVNSAYFYIRSPHDQVLQIFDLSKWAESLFTYSNRVYNQNTHWYVLEDGIYSFKVSTINSFVTKFSLDGRQSMWHVLIPYCVTTYPQNQIFITSRKSITYVLCNTANLIVQYNDTTGSIIETVPADKGGVVAIESSPSSLYILYTDTSVVQYSLKWSTCSPMLQKVRW